MDNKDKYILNCYHGSYLLRESKLTNTFIKLNMLLNVDGLNIDATTYHEDFIKIEQEVRELEKSNNITTNLYQEYTGKLDSLSDAILNEYRPLRIVELYLESISGLLSDDESNYDDLNDRVAHLIDYLDEVKEYDKKSYQEIYDKYGLLENKTIIEFAVLANNQRKK